MADYGLKFDKHEIISGSSFIFRSGSISDFSTSISASTAQVIAITCSANYNNRLTKLTSINANATITITSGSKNISNLQNDNKLILRYFSGSEIPEKLVPVDSEATIDHLLAGIGTNVIYVDIPLLNNDDSHTVATKTVRALTSSIGYNKTFKAKLVGSDPGVGFSSIEGGFIIDQYFQNLDSSLGDNMTIGNSFKIRSTPTYELQDDYLVSSSGFFTITSLNSGSVATPDFSGTETQVGGMQLETSFLIGGGSGSQAFAFNLVNEGSGNVNQEFFEGFPIPSSASISMQLDPNDKTSGLITGSGEASLYMSSSGRIGIGTTDPTAQFEVAADEHIFRRRENLIGLKINREGNVESFNKDATNAATGSEVILSYTAGGASTVTTEAINAVFGNVIDISASQEEINVFFNNLESHEQSKLLHHMEKIGAFGGGSVGDVVGSVRWVIGSGSVTVGGQEESALNARTTGEIAAISTVILESNPEGTVGKLQFKVANEVDEGASTHFEIYPGGYGVYSGSLDIYNGYGLGIGNSNVDGSDRSISFRHATAPFIMGIDDSQDRFVIHSHTSFANSSDFEMDSSGNIIIKGNLTVNGTLTNETVIHDYGTF